MRKCLRLLFLPVTIFLAGCWTWHKIDTTHKIEPIEININVNIKIQDELKEKFEKQDKLEEGISDKEAEEALKKYLESEE